MTELSGTLDGVGLPAIVRFLGGLNKTGCLRIAHEQWRGEIFFELGRVTGASLGTRKGLSALDALVQSLPGGSFTFDAGARAADESTISLSAEAVLAHLDELVTRMANGTSQLPSFDVVPSVLGEDISSAGEAPLPLDRGTLQTLVLIDGQRTVRQIVAQRGSLDALWQLANLVEVGLIRLSAKGSVAAKPSPPSSIAAAPPVHAAPSTVVKPPTEPVAIRPERLDTARRRPVAGVAAEVGPRCPKLGFEDDPANSFGRPTRLHRCFAAGTPLALSVDQQRELCLSNQFSTCPRLTMGGFVPPARDAQAANGFAAGRQPGVRRAEPEPQRQPQAEADDPRIVRLPFVGRANAAERGAVADRQAVGSSEPTRFRPAGTPVRDGISSSPPTPLRSRIDRSTPPVATDAVVEPTVRPRPERRDVEPRVVRELPVENPLVRRLGRIPMWFIAGGSVVVAVLAIVAYLMAPPMNGLFGDEGLDTSGLPNTSAVAAGTPVAQVTGRRPTPVSRATAVSLAPEAAGALNNPAATSVAAAPAPTPPPPPTQPAQPAATVLFDERFTTNDRNWPSSAQGTAVLTGGSYQLAPRQAGKFVAVGAPITDVLKDVVVSATFHKISGPSGGGYGIIVRDQSPVPQNGNNQDGGYYVLEVGDKGEVGIWRRDGDHWVDLLPWQPNPAVNPDTAINEVSVRAVGNRLTLSVNGTQVATKTDDTFTAGGVGLFVGGDGNQVAVDHFSIQTP